METSIETSKPLLNPVDALWTIFMSQTKKVRREFADRVIASEYNAITPSLAKKITKVEKAMLEGKTVHFDSIEQLDSYLEAL